MDRRLIGRPRRWWVTLFCGAAAVLGTSDPAAAQVNCRPPEDLFVCQDRYGATGRVFVFWTNGELAYASIRLYVDGSLFGEGPGTARSALVEDVALGVHTFEVEGICSGGTRASTSATFTVLPASPHTMPVASVSCTYDASRARYTAVFQPSGVPSLFVDVYIRRFNTTGFVFVGTVVGNPPAIVVNAVESTDRLFFQFFNADCYGSALIGCDEAVCGPVVDVRVCQDIYGARSRVFVLWEAGASPFTSFEVFVDGVLAGTADATRTFLYVDPIAPGIHEFAVRGVCAGAATERVVRSFDVLAASPHTEPVENLRCRFDPATGVFAAAWQPGAEASDFIDVYIRRSGVSLLDFAGTIPGDRSQVRVRGVETGDEIVLQFFNAACYGSPLITCVDDGGGAFQDFRRGDTNDSGTVDISDSITALQFLFLGGLEPLCVDAADANDDGRFDIADVIYGLSWLFGRGPIPPAPGPFGCGPDPSDDSLPRCLTGFCP